MLKTYTVLAFLGLLAFAAYGTNESPNDNLPVQLVTVNAEKEEIQVELLRAFVESILEDELQEHSENVFQVASSSANRSVWWMSALVAGLGVTTGVLAALTGYGVSQIRKDHAVAQGIIGDITKNQHESERVSSLIRKRAAETAKEHNQMKTLIEDAKRQLGEQAAEVGREVRNASRIVLDMALNEAIISLARKGESKEGSDERFAAIGVIGEFGAERHIRYLRAAASRDYESDDNRGEIGKAIERIRERAMRDREEA